MKLQDEVAVITGAGSGIGRATALLFAKEGATVVVSDFNDEGGKETVGLIEAAGGKASFVHADVTNEDEMKGLFEAAESEHGKVTIVYNNAGAMIRGPVTEIDIDAFQRNMTLNVTGVVLGCKYGVAALRRNGGGAIVNTASALSFIGVPNASAYCAAKGAVLQFTRAVAAETSKEGIRVNAICPGLIDTAFYAPDYEKGADPDEFKATNGSRAPMGRMGNAEEIAAAVVYLASSDASYVTGTALSVDGGITAV
jgi:meso-butanediol dehydrogenase / (S,S)-butanediol dehydrogenase / diacetyl reductase